MSEPTHPNTAANKKQHRYQQPADEQGILPVSKRQKVATIGRTSTTSSSANVDDTAGSPLSPISNKAFTIVQEATHKLAKLVEDHPQFHSKMEGILHMLRINMCT